MKQVVMEDVLTKESFYEHISMILLRKKYQ